MLVEALAVVRGQHDEGALAEAEGVELREDARELVVEIADLAVVLPDVEAEVAGHDAVLAIDLHLVRRQVLQGNPLGRYGCRRRDGGTRAAAGRDRGDRCSGARGGRAPRRQALEKRDRLVADDRRVREVLDEAGSILQGGLAGLPPQLGDPRLDESIEALIEPQALADVGIRYDRGGLVAGAAEHFGEGRLLLAERPARRVDPHALRVLAGQHRRHRGPGLRPLNRRVREADAGGRERVHRRARVEAIAIGAEVIGAERVDRHQEEVRTRPARGPRVAGGQQEETRQPRPGPRGSSRAR